MSPLTKKGRKMKGIFIQEYGKKRGSHIFYAFENKNNRFAFKKKRLTI
jgi:hypothetical protein